MNKKVLVKEIECISAIGKCGFPGGGWAINPYVGCEHGCVYCYARFIKRFTGHNEAWGSFVDVRTNIADVLARQIKNPKYHQGIIYLGTVTDPYQPVEKKYKLSRKILEVLKDFPVTVSVLTKSDLVLRDLDLIKSFKKIDVNFTINTLDKKWKKLVEPYPPSVEARLEAAKNLVDEGIKVYAMMGPYWPIFTDPQALFKKFKEVGISRVFTESFNTTGGNWKGVQEKIKKNYPKILPKMEKIFFEKQKFYEFYSGEKEKIEKLSKDYQLPVTIFFGLGHAAKFK